MNKIRLGSCFSGIGAWEKGFENLNIDIDLKWFCEIDKYASTAYCAIHNVNENLNKIDATKINIKELDDIDVFTYSPPCQSFSIAGKRLGLQDPRGNMFYYALPIIKEKKPKYALMENVKGLVSGKFKSLFQDMLKQLSDAGYNNYYKVLNAKDYGVPQNRERVFIISIRKDIDDGYFKFPEPFDNGLRLRDMLGKKVDEKYYVYGDKCEKLIQKLKQKEISNSIRIGGKSSFDRHSWDLVVVDSERESSTNNKTKIFPCLTSDRLNKRYVGNTVQTNNLKKLGYLSKDSQGYRVYDANNIACTQTASAGGLGATTGLYLVNYKIRNLTPLECWRLMGFNDTDYSKVKQILELKFYNGKDRSDSQMYKMAGNSIVVNVIEEIYKNLFR